MHAQLLENQTRHAFGVTVMMQFNLHSESEQKPRGIRPFKPLGLFSDARDMGNRLLKASKTFTEDTIPPFPLKCGH